MSAPQFTPGPWVVGTGGVSKQIPIMADDGIVVCELDGFSCDVSADADLIAAAPELYEALWTCVKLCDKALGKPMNLSGQSPLDIANAALAKARGEAA